MNTVAVLVREIWRPGYGNLPTPEDIATDI